MKKSEMLHAVLLALPTISEHHAPGTPLYELLKTLARAEIERLFSDEQPTPARFGPFGQVTFPYHSMGAVDSLNLFDLDELIIFSFYWANRTRYRKVLDIGANLGLHSVLLSKCGYDVSCYEPDPVHFEILKKNLDLNGIQDVRSFNMAVSTKTGEMEFVRVPGNTTGSHLSGAKEDGRYSNVERFPVSLEAFQSISTGVDLVKMDIEGHEKEVLSSTIHDDWDKMDALVEIESPHNAKVTYEHLSHLGVRLFSQKTGWRLVASVDGMPTGYREGSLFVTTKDEMPWGSAAEIASSEEEAGR